LIVRRFAQGLRNGFGHQALHSFEALEKYCYHVASVVGLLSIEIFGYKNPACRDYAVHLGRRSSSPTSCATSAPTPSATGFICRNPN